MRVTALVDGQFAGQRVAWTQGAEELHVAHALAGYDVPVVVDAFDHEFLADRECMYSAADQPAEDTGFGCFLVGVEPLGIPPRRELQDSVVSPAGVA